VLSSPLTAINSLSLYWPLGVPMPPLPVLDTYIDLVAPDALRAIPLLPVTFRSFTAKATQWLPR
jgi:hypothetical protein